MKSEKSAMKVVHALYNDIVCSDGAILKDIEIIPFSTIFMCSDLYELIIHFPDNTTTTIYKQYYTCFDTILQELAVCSHVGILRIETLFCECAYDFSLSSYTLSCYFHHYLHWAALPSVWHIHRPHHHSDYSRLFYEF